MNNLVDLFFDRLAVFDRRNHSVRTVSYTTWKNTKNKCKFTLNLLLIFMLAGCSGISSMISPPTPTPTVTPIPTPTATPVPTPTMTIKEEYSQEMSSVFVDLNELVSGPITEWAILSNEPILPGNEISYGQALELVIDFSDGFQPDDIVGSERAKFFFPNYSKFLKNVKAFIPIAEKMSDDSFSLLVKLNGVYAPDEVWLAHLELTDCVQYYADYSSQLLNWFQNGGYISVNDQACIQMRRSLKLIGDYINKEPSITLPVY